MKKREKKPIILKGKLESGDKYVMVIPNKIYKMIENFYKVKNGIQ